MDEAEAAENRSAGSVSIRVRYFETDQMGVAHHANYFVWFEAARTEFCRRFGIDYAGMEKAGQFLPVVDARCRYRSPAHYDDLLVITVSVLERSRRMLKMGYTVTCGDIRVADGETMQILVDAQGKARSFPQEIARLFDRTGDEPA